MTGGILYVISNDWIREPESNIRPYKIGITKNSVDERYYGIGLKMPGTFETIFAYKLDDYEKAEKLIHGILKKYRVKGEWFKIEQKELDLIKMNCEAMGGILITDEVTDVIDEQINTDQENEDETVKERTFSYEGKEYIARLYKHKDDSYIFGGIFYGDSKCQNMKNIVREYLKSCGKNIPLDASVNTHTAVKILIKILDEEK